MSLTVAELASLLDGPIERVLSHDSFSDWDYERSYDPKLGTEVYHSFNQAGMEVVSGADGKVDTIFLFNKDGLVFRSHLADFTFNTSRADAKKRFGRPLSSGENVVDKYLGKLGAWDKFELASGWLRLEYDDQEELVTEATISTYQVPTL